LRHTRIPRDWRSFALLHLPTEKTLGLSRLFDLLSALDSPALTREAFASALDQSIPLDSPRRLFRRNIWDFLRRRLRPRA